MRRAPKPTTRPRGSRSAKDEPAREVVVAAAVHEPGGHELLLREPASPAPWRASCGRRARRRGGNACRSPRPGRARRDKRAQAPLGALPTGTGRRTPPLLRAPRRAGRDDGGAPPRAVSSPRTRAGTPVRSASHSTASAKSSPSVSRTKAIRSPPVPQPKQWKSFRSGFTEKLGVRSSWKGQRPVQRVPTRRSGVRAGHDRDHVGRVDDSLDRLALDQRHASAKRSVMPET